MPTLLEIIDICLMDTSINLNDYPAKSLVQTIMDAPTFELNKLYRLTNTTITRENLNSLSVTARHNLQLLLILRAGAMARLGMKDDEIGGDDVSMQVHKALGIMRTRKDGVMFFIESETREVG